MSLETRVTKLENATGADPRSILTVILRDGEEPEAGYRRTLRELAEQGKRRDHFLPKPVHYVRFRAGNRA